MVLEHVGMPQPGDCRVVFSASAEELETLPGIGRVLARRIVAFREENGCFSRLEELMQVEGIGEKRIAQILDLITIGG